MRSGAAVGMVGVAILNMSLPANPRSTYHLGYTLPMDVPNLLLLLLLNIVSPYWLSLTPLEWPLKLQQISPLLLHHFPVGAWVPTLSLSTLLLLFLSFFLAGMPGDPDPHNPFLVWCPPLWVLQSPCWVEYCRVWPRYHWLLFCSISVVWWHLESGADPVECRSVGTPFLHNSLFQK